MKERPILFSAPMVRSLLAGTKTQTRRVVKPQPEVVPDAFPTDGVQRGVFRVPVKGQRGTYDCLGSTNFAQRFSPYGQSGDRLWVRENGWERPERSPRDMREGADTWPPYEYDAELVSTLSVEDLKAWKWKRRPSIHMPRWASRLTLEVVAVRVERLQEITPQDAFSEGITNKEVFEAHPDIEATIPPRAFVDTYRLLWESINGPGSWDANPWVWVVEFQRLAR